MRSLILTITSCIIVYKILIENFLTTREPYKSSIRSLILIVIPYIFVVKNLNLMRMGLGMFGIFGGLIAICIGSF